MNGKWNIILAHPVRDKVIRGSHPRKRFFVGIAIKGDTSSPEEILPVVMSVRARSGEFSLRLDVPGAEHRLFLPRLLARSKEVIVEYVNKYSMTGLYWPSNAKLVEE